MSMTNELSSLRTNDEKEENFFIRFFKYFIPWKGDGIAEIFRKFVFVGSVVVFCFSLGNLSEYLNGNAKTNELIKEMQEIKPFSNDGDNAQSVDHESDNSGTDAPEGGGDSENLNAEIDPSWNELLSINEDVVGWIAIDTMRGPDGEIYIDYPVVQGDDNEYYLDHDIKKKRNSSGGTIFMDYGSSIVPGEKTDNVIIFGHNMKAGTFFGRLDEYKSGVEFLRNNPLVTFNTIYSGSTEKYIIVSCFLASIYEEQDNGNVFKYVGYRNFDDNRPFETWKEEITKRSWYTSDIEFNEDDDYITLSTCSSDISDMRWVIVARKVRATDDVDALVQTYVEREDEDIYFPQRWIRSWGHKKVYRN